ncbi:MAG TPA: glucokinase [Thermoanaerobaculia bacterium]|nr:glucokinase [Thermoanaerobaculia bacterium]
MTRRLLAADIGGTKVFLQTLEKKDGGWSPVLERRYESDVYPSFDSVLREFLAVGGPVDAACLAAAGPVDEAKIQVTNLGWIIESAAVGRDFGIRAVRVVNDFYAVAAGVPLLAPEDLIPIHPVPALAGAPIAILGAGTGLGEALVVPSGEHWIVVPSEGGHADFAPNDERQDALLRHLRARYGHVSTERVVSGMGLVNIVTFLRDHEPELGRFDFTNDAEGEDDLPPLIAARDREGNPLARATFDLFIDAYGAEAGNLALKYLPRGGIYLAGGIASKNVARLTDGRFMRAFSAKGRFADLVLECPVHVIANPRVGLRGAAHLASLL